jgi:hypothetical protein
MIDEERDERECERRQVAQDLNLDDRESRKPRVEVCDVHGLWQPTGLMDECPGCWDDEYNARHAWVDPEYLPARFPAA